MRSQGTWLHSSGYGEFKCLDYIASVIQTQNMWLPSTKKADNWKPGFSIIWKGLCRPSVTDGLVVFSQIQDTIEKFSHLLWKNVMFVWLASRMEYRAVAKCVLDHVKTKTNSKTWKSSERCMFFLVSLKSLRINYFYHMPFEKERL